jgi:hypothetical protein
MAMTRRASTPGAVNVSIPTGLRRGAKVPSRRLTNHAKDGGEDVIHERVRKRRDGRGTPPLQSRGGRARAQVVGHKGRCRAVEVAAAVEGHLHQVLDVGGLVPPDEGKLPLGPQRADPEEDADAHGEEAAERHQEARRLQPPAARRQDARQRHDEGDEDHDGVDDAGVEREALVQQVARRLLALGRRLRHEVPDQEGEAELGGAGCHEEHVGHHHGEEDLVRHVGWLLPQTSMRRNRWRRGPNSASASLSLLSLSLSIPPGWK